MSKKNAVTIEEIIAIAKDAHRFSHVEYELLSSVAYTPPPKAPRRAISITHATSDDASFQEKLKFAYGL